MSAYLISAYGIGRLAAYLAHSRDDARRVHYFAERINATVEGPMLAAAIAMELAEANADSIIARYGGPEDEPGDWWGWTSVGEFVEACEAEAMKPWKDDHPHHVVIGACDNFDYQACEYEGWRSSDAHTLLGMIKDRAVSNLLKKLDLDPGWGMREEDATPFAGILLSELCRN